jgi:hypothetical protein
MFAARFIGRISRSPRLGDTKLGASVRNAAIRKTGLNLIFT